MSIDNNNNGSSERNLSSGISEEFEKPIIFNLFTRIYHFYLYIKWLWQSRHLLWSEDNKEDLDDLL